jgi:hypothetical protein
MRLFGPESDSAESKLMEAGLCMLFLNREKMAWNDPIFGKAHGHMS